MFEEEEEMIRARLTLHAASTLKSQRPRRKREFKNLHHEEREEHEGKTGGEILRVAEIVRFPSSGSGLPVGFEQDSLTKQLSPQREEQHGNAFSSVSISVHPWLNIGFRSCSSSRHG